MRFGVVALRSLLTAIGVWSGRIDSRGSGNPYGLYRAAEGRTGTVSSRSPLLSIASHRASPLWRVRSNNGSPLGSQMRFPNAADGDELTVRSKRAIHGLRREPEVLQVVAMPCLPLPLLRLPQLPVLHGVDCRPF